MKSIRKKEIGYAEIDNSKNFPPTAEKFISQFGDFNSFILEKMCV